MAKLMWDQTGEKYFELGVSHGVLYPYAANAYGKGVAWNGLTQVSENPSGAEANAIWADNIKYANIISSEDFGCTIEAFAYPPEFEACDGSASLAEGVTIGQQKRKMFGFCYRTEISSDAEEADETQEAGYKLHLVYGCMAAPSSKDRNTINENPDPMTMSWDVSTTPVPVTGHRPTAHLIIDSRRADATKLKALEAILYGSDSAGSDTGTDPRLPLPDEIKKNMS